MLRVWAILAGGVKTFNLSYWGMWKGKWEKKLKKWSERTKWEKEVKKEWEKEKWKKKVREEKKRWGWYEGWNWWNHDLTTTLRMCSDLMVVSWWFWWGVKQKKYFSAKDFESLTKNKNNKQVGQPSSRNPKPSIKLRIAVINLFSCHLLFLV
jgi:hypothetical protein